jgi:hypothetical protein
MIFCCAQQLAHGQKDPANRSLSCGLEVETSGREKPAQKPVAPSALEHAFAEMYAKKSGPQRCPGKRFSLQISQKPTPGLEPGILHYE